jgi:hypothetical protein
MDDDKPSNFSLTPVVPAMLPLRLGSPVLRKLHKLGKLTQNAAGFGIEYLVNGVRED